MTYDDLILEFPFLKPELLFIKKRREKWDILRDYVQVLHQLFLDIETRKINKRYGKDL